MYKIREHVAPTPATTSVLDPSVLHALTHPLPATRHHLTFSLFHAFSIAKYILTEVSFFFVLSRIRPLQFQYLKYSAFRIPNSLALEVVSRVTAPSNPSTILLQIQVFSNNCREMWQASTQL